MGRSRGGRRACARGSGQFSDKFGHENCIILAIHANPQLSLRAVNALITVASARIGQCREIREVGSNPNGVASLVNERVYSHAINRWAGAAFGHFLNIDAIATLLNHTRGKRGFTLNSTRRCCSQSEFRISYPARIYRELKTITLLAPFDRADRNRIAVLAGCGESHSAFYLLGHRHYSAGGMDGARDRGASGANGGRSRRAIECHVRERGGTDHCCDCALERLERRSQSVDCRLDYRQHSASARLVDLVRRDKVQRAAV